MVRVLIVEDNEPLRRVMVRLLSARPEVEVVGDCEDVAAALVALAEAEVDVVLMDFHLPDMNGAAAVAALRARGDQTRVLILSGSADLVHVEEALAAGASGYVVKRANVEELLQGIAAVARGRTYRSRTTGDVKP
ncbi:MAG: response regulator transcription factor [Dehalococcoidia bacterium]